MKTMKFIAFFLAFYFPLVPIPAEEAPENHEHVLKERSAFNQLKKETRNIYKVRMKSSVVYKLQTALGYVSTIDLPEKALKVFVGDQDLFKVGVYEKQVLVKPITDEPDGRTNLIVVTRSGRLSFDISTGPPETADFVLDFRLPGEEDVLVKDAIEEKVKEKEEVLKKDFEEKEKSLEKKVEVLSEEKLKTKIAQEAKTVTLKGSGSKENVQVNLLSLSKIGGKAYLRFSVLNYSKTPYRVLKAIVGRSSKESGFAEIPSELTLEARIDPDQYVYGVITFDFEEITKKEKPVFRLLEEEGKRNIEISKFSWIR